MTGLAPRRASAVSGASRLGRLGASANAGRDRRRGRNRTAYHAGTPAENGGSAAQKARRASGKDGGQGSPDGLARCAADNKRRVARQAPGLVPGSAARPRTAAPLVPAFHLRVQHLAAVRAQNAALILMMQGEDAYGVSVKRSETAASLLDNGTWYVIDALRR